MCAKLKLHPIIFEIHTNGALRFHWIPIPCMGMRQVEPLISFNDVYLQQFAIMVTLSSVQQAVHQLELSMCV